MGKTIEWGKIVNMKFSKIIPCFGIVVEKEEDMLIKYRHPNPLKSGIMKKRTHTRVSCRCSFFFPRVHYIVVMAGMGSTQTNWHYQLKKNETDTRWGRENRENPENNSLKHVKRHASPTIGRYWFQLKANFMNTRAQGERQKSRITKQKTTSLIEAVE